jgi:hypothetical protein
MLEISPASMKAFQETSLLTLRRRLLVHWEDQLPDPFARAGDDGCKHVLLEVEELGREDPNLSFSDLFLLADICLVSWVNSNRPIAKGSR